MPLYRRIALAICTVYADSGLCGARVNYSVSAVDICKPVAIQQFDFTGKTSGSIFPLGTTLQEYDFSTRYNKTYAFCQFNVTVLDSVKPQITCPANITVPNDSGLCGAVVNYSISASDDCSAVTQSQSDSTGLTSGSFFPAGITSQRWTATDTSGNLASCTFSVHVTDTTAPRIVCPANIVVANDSGVCGALVSYQISSSDNCAATQAQSDSSGLTSGDVFPVGATNQTWTATDAAGNAASCTFSITVNDTTAPVLSCRASAVRTVRDSCHRLVILRENFTDNCAGGTVVDTFVASVGFTRVWLYAEDAAGNRDSCRIRITLLDGSLPVLSCPSNIVAYADSGRCGAVVNYSVSATDNCVRAGADQDDDSGLTSGDFFPVGTTTQEFVSSAPFQTGRSSCSFTVTVVDSTAPNLVCPANIVVPNDSGACGARVDFSISSSDYCPAVVSQTDSSGLDSGDIFPVGTTTPALCRCRRIGK
ncbi:MAG: HYR domain-containing protein [Bacteroidia bacterium]